MIEDDTTAQGGNGIGGSARQQAIHAYESARESVAGAGRRTAASLGEAPLIALAGGLAAGALIAALMPRTRSEDRLVRPTARRVKDTARAAFDAARDTGSQRLDELGLTKEKGEETIRTLFQGVTDAARASAEAALEAARKR
jgi:hypothetical protein